MTTSNLRLLCCMRGGWVELGAGTSDKHETDTSLPKPLPSPPLSAPASPCGHTAAGHTSKRRLKWPQPISPKPEEYRRARERQCGTDDVGLVKNGDAHAVPLRVAAAARPAAAAAAARLARMHGGRWGIDSANRLRVARMPCGRIFAVRCGPQAAAAAQGPWAEPCGLPWVRVPQAQHLPTCVHMLAYVRVCACMACSNPPYRRRPALRPPAPAPAGSPQWCPATREPPACSSKRTGRGCMHAFQSPPMWPKQWARVPRRSETTAPPDKGSATVGQLQTELQPHHIAH
jgi:hypothetical protein